MHVLVNGDEHVLPGSPTVTDLLATLGVRGRIAVEINGELVPRSLHASHVLADGDRVEIVQAIGGGAYAPNRDAPGTKAGGADDSSGRLT